MSVLSTDDARAVITTSLSDAELQDVIDREESWLAGKVGPLTGERVQSFVTEDGDEVLRLTRHASSISSVEDDDGAYSGYALRAWSDIAPSSSDAWAGTVEVTYTPDDEPGVQKAIITLVRLAISETAYQSESAGGYVAVTDHAAQKDLRYTAWNSLLRPRIPTTTRLKSAIPAGGLTISPVWTEATGS